MIGVRVITLPLWCCDLQINNCYSKFQNWRNLTNCFTVQYIEYWFPGQFVFHVFMVWLTRETLSDNVFWSADCIYDRGLWSEGYAKAVKPGVSCQLDRREYSPYFSLFYDKITFTSSHLLYLAIRLYLRLRTKKKLWLRLISLWQENLTFKLVIF